MSTAVFCMYAGARPQWRTGLCLCVLLAVLVALAAPARGQLALTQGKALAATRLSAAQLQSIRRAEIMRAAQLYTGIAFSAQNQQKMKASLPLSQTRFSQAVASVRSRFEACMEGALEARLENAYTAQVLRKTIQSTQDKAMKEPKDARTAMPAFSAANGYCSSRIEPWLAAVMQ